ncbi:L,D-transpeptidase family protein [Hoeflea sp. WL0058]|uniref:L,D-transpeptidase family protein n=1 Tax=Flavimaribacter sediminis TaxID=2865987 RepID=A0AAE3D3X7_9HYPH|nr:murein L,D-transpeptidase family protein [Flavimaribacter sediminis]MBW8640582.1 L,D-transpeptidase family protein [Flavimaribacter sediminis]
MPVANLAKARRLKTIIAVIGLSLALTACQDVLESVDNKAEYPLPDKLVNKMKAHDQRVRAPIMMRIFKEEGVLEIWKAKTNGRYAMVKEYEICKWSGKLGPKFKEGDRQAPEGYYEIRPYQMNPKSNYYLAFNMGYPNTYDRSHGRTGSNLMVHGACSSAGCYSMTDEQVLEIYAFAREAFRGGQPFFQVQAYPFRMTAENMARHRGNDHYEFWEMLKVGYDHFELTKMPPKVDICDRRYVFNQVADDGKEFNARQACPPSEAPQSLRLAYASYLDNYNTEFAAEVSKLEAKRKPRVVSIVPEAQATPEQSTPELNNRNARNVPATAGLLEEAARQPTGEVAPADAPQAEQPLTAAPGAAPELPETRETAEITEDQQAVQPQDAKSKKTWWKVWKRE